MRQRSLIWFWISGVLAVAVLFADSLATLRSIRSTHEDAKWVVHTHRVLEGLTELQSDLSAAGSSERGYLASGDPRFLDGYSEAKNSSKSKWSDVKELTADNEPQQVSLIDLHKEMSARFDSSDSAIRQRQSTIKPGTNQIPRPDLAMPRSDSAASLIDVMTGREEKLLQDRAKRSERTYAGAVLGGLISGVTAVAAVAALIFLWARRFSASERHADLVAGQAERLRITLESIGDAVIVTDSNGLVTNLNPIATALTGWTKAEASGLPLERVFQIINEVTRLPVDNPGAIALREGRIVGLANHTILVGKDGTERPIDDRAAPIMDAEGKISGVVLVFRDVMEQRSAEKAQSVLASIVADSDDAIISKSLEGIIVTWNSGAERLFGYEAAEVVGKSIRLIIPPELQEEEDLILGRLRAGERITHYETIRVTKGGRRCNVSLTVSPLRNSEGEIIGASKVARDITDQKKIESELRFLADASASLAGIFDYNEALKTVADLAVPNFADWCAVDLVEPEETLKRVAVAHVDPTKVRLAEELHRKYPSDPDRPNGTWRIIHSGKSELIEEITQELLHAAVQDPELLNTIRELGLRSYIGVPLAVRGEVFGVITFVSAESDRRYDWRDLKVAEDLAHRAAVAIENARLYFELQQTDSRKDRFLAVLAHELRNPLAPIQYSLEVAKQIHVEDDTLAKAHITIERQLGHLVRLVDDLLDISRITRDKVELRCAKTSLTHLLNQAVEAATPFANNLSQSIHLELPTKELNVYGDPTRLAQVFSNLLNNACKFSESGQTISLIAKEEGTDVVVEVHDDGIGIPAEMLPHIFEMFMQVDDSINRSHGGLGIGLTLVRRLVEMHGGAVSAYSEGVGLGSEFVVRLPSSSEQATEAEPIASSSRKPGIGEPRKVLVVDDNEDTAEALAKLIEVAGHSVERATDGAMAVKVADSFRPDIVLLDVGLPKMSGHEVAKWIRTQSWGQKARLIAVTGWGQEEDRRASREAGFDVHLVKPITYASLVEALSTEA